MAKKMDREYATFKKRVEWMCGSDIRNLVTSFLPLIIILILTPIAWKLVGQMEKSWVPWVITSITTTIMCLMIFFGKRSYKVQLLSEFHTRRELEKKFFYKGGVRC